MIILVLIATMNIIISMTLKVVDIDGTSQLLTTELAEDKTYMKWCNYWDQVIITIIIVINITIVIKFQTVISDSQ